MPNKSCLAEKKRTLNNEVLCMHTIPQLMNDEDNYYGLRSVRDTCTAARAPRRPRSFVTALALSSGIFGDDSAETLTRRGPARGSGPHFSVSAKPAASLSSSTAPTSAVPSPTSAVPLHHHQRRWRHPRHISRSYPQGHHRRASSLFRYRFLEHRHRAPT